MDSGTLLILWSILVFVTLCLLLSSHCSKGDNYLFIPQGLTTSLLSPWYPLFIVLTSPVLSSLSPAN